MPLQKMLQITKPVLCLLIGMTATIGSVAIAAPVTYEFAYHTFQNYGLKGILEGELLDDNNTIVVSSIKTASYNNDMLGPVNVSIAANRVSLNGHGILFTATDVSAKNQLIISSAPGNAFYDFVFSGYNTQTGIGYEGRSSGAYSASNWIISEVKSQAVSEPNSLVLANLGLIGVLLLARRRRKL